MFIQITDGNPVGSPINEHQFRALFPNISFQRPWASDEVVSRGYAFFQDAASPEPGRYEVVEDSSPVQVDDDLWEKGWSLRAMSESEIASTDEYQADISRLQRNAKLTRSDWTQSNDSPLSENDKNAWAQYRSELRNVPEQSGFPWDINWPTEPV